MKSKIFLYLFVLALLYILFQQVNAKKKFEIDEKRMAAMTQKIEGHTKEKDSLENKIMDLSYFSLEFDEYAIEYIEETGYTVAELEELVTSALISKNSAKNDNPLIPFAGMEGNTLIDRVKLINHKWAIVDFTDGKYWGQVIYTYILDDKDTLTLDVIASQLYPKID